MILQGIELGKGPPLVLLHGLFGAARNFGAVQRRLAERFRVIALDLRNHGASPHGPVAGYGDLADDVYETLVGSSVLPASIVGHSMGGKVAMRLALGRPDAVTRLLVADIAPVRYKSHFAGYATAMAAMPMPVGLTRTAAEEWLRVAVPDREVRLFLLQNLITGAEPRWRIGLEHIRAALPAIEDWQAPVGAQYAGPSLFVLGERSDYVLPAHRQPIRHLFPAVRFVTLRDAGHWVHVDAPDAFTGTIRAFLGQ